jgi:hypothetical protein
MKTDIDKAFEIANFMTTLNNQKRILHEEYNQSLYYYKDGNTFKATPEFISFVSSIVQSNIESSVILDQNGIPVLVSDIKDLLTSLISTYTEASNGYFYNYQKLISSKTVESILDK